MNQYDSITHSSRQHTIYVQDRPLILGNSIVHKNDSLSLVALEVPVDGCRDNTFSLRMLEREWHKVGRRSQLWIVKVGFELVGLNVVIVVFFGLVG